MTHGYKPLSMCLLPRIFYKLTHALLQRIKRVDQLFINFARKEQLSYKPTKMSTCVVTTFLLLLAMANSMSCLPELNTTLTTTTITVQHAQAKLLQAKNWVQYSSMDLHGLDRESSNNVGFALRDCNKLYDESEPRLSRLVSGATSRYTADDALTWLSAVLANHRSCLEGLAEKGFVEAQSHLVAQNLTTSLGEALALYSKMKSTSKEKIRKYSILYIAGFIL